MPLSKLTTILGADPRWKRYHSGEYTSLDEIADPETWADETRTTWRDWVSQSRGNQALVAVAMMLGVGLVVYFSQLFIRLSTGLLSNTIFQVLAGSAVLVGVTYVYAISAQRDRFEELDWLVLPKDDGGVIRFLGYYREGDNTEAPLYVPVKGFRRSGHKAEPYRVYEISGELAQKYKQTNRDPEDVAVIRLQPEQARVTHTETGTVIVQPTTKLKLDEFGNESCLKAPVSEQQADTDAVQDLKRSLDDLRTEVSGLKEDLTKEERLKREAKKNAEKRRQEIINEFLNNSEKAAEAFRPRDRRRQSEDTDDGIGATPRSGVDQIDQQMAHNDD